LIQKKYTHGIKYLFRSDSAEMRVVAQPVECVSVDRFGGVDDA